MNLSHDGPRQAGFSLIELLIVIAILGILLALGIVNYTRSIRAAEVREGAALISSQLRQARSEAQKNSVDMVMTWDAAGRYGIAPAGSTITLQSLPNNLRLRCVTTCAGSSVRFSAPFGELANGTGTVWQVSSPQDGIRPYEVRLVGVTGKAMMVPGAN